MSPCVAHRQLLAGTASAQTLKKVQDRGMLVCGVSGGLAGFSNGEGTPSHLPSHAEVSLAAGKSFSQNLSGSVTVLNLTDRHLLVDNSLTFGGFHYNNPREIYAQLHYRR